jgi:tetratricopeptide (TPR) repeat protein/predicted Ser/Thr protein kinase
VVGQTLGRYRVLERLGAGGAGVVYRAFDEHLQRDVAIKVLAAATFADEAERKRFHKEALILSKLNHPNIATLHDFTRDGDLEFLVMEYIPGTPLNQVVARGPLSEAETLHLGLQIADALDEAHGLGVVHRDLKPGNIMLTPKRQVKVLDFGLARQLQSHIDSATTRAAGQAEGVAGTVPYMAPEQLRGESLDARTDVHALGVVLYELATGRRPYAGDTVPMLTEAILHELPVRPSALAVHLSSRVDRIVLKCLAKEPAGRYQSARLLGNDLREARDDLARALPAGAGIRRWAGPTAAVIAAGVLIAGALVGLAPRLWNQPTALLERDVILLAGVENRTREKAFDGSILRDALAFKLMESPFLNLYPPEDVRNALHLMERRPDTQLDEALAREICLREGLKATVSGSIEAVGSTFVIQLKAVEARSGAALAAEYAEVASKEHVVRRIGQMAADLRKKLGESLASVQAFDVPLEQATTSSLEALQAYSAGVAAMESGQSASAFALFTRATELDPDFAVAYAGLARAYGNDNRMTDMRNAASTAYRLRQRASQRERLSIEFTYYASVLEDVRRGIEVAELQVQLYRRDAAARTNLGAYYRTFGRYEDALAQFRQALALSPRAAGRTQGNMAWTYQFMGRSDLAAEFAQKALSAGYDSVGVRQLLYLIAATREDGPAMEAQVRALTGGPQDHLAERWEGDRAAYAGRVAQARGRYARAAQLAEQRGLANRAAIERAWAALVDAQVGLCANVGVETGAAVERSRDVSVLRDAINALAACGQALQAERLLQELTRDHAQSTYVNAFVAPDLRAEIALQRRQFEKALTELEPLARYSRTSFGIRAAYRRGRALLGLGHTATAAREFETILNNRGLDALSLHLPLARLYLARAAKEGDVPLARRRYEEFLGAWTGADRNLPILKAASEESAALSHAAR